MSKAADESMAAAGDNGGRLRQWPLIVVLLGLAASLAVVAIVDFRPGAIGLAATLLLAAVFRLVLPERVAGLLALRRRVWDVLTLLVLGSGILILALVVPEIG